MVLLESTKVPIGTPAKDFSLTGTDDKQYSLADFKGAKALVVIFMCNHCPYVRAQWSRLTALQEKYRDAGVRFVGINSNFNPDYPEDSYEKMKEYFVQYKMNFPYLQDPAQEVARLYGAKCTPDIFVYDAEQKLAYHGRIDDNWKDAEAAKKHELDEALVALVKGETPDLDQKPSMGCSIKWRD
ncbi:MAG: thioredoxin family protein [Bacteroidota bacterium]